MSINVLTREQTIGFGKGKQTDAATASLIANIWRLNKLNADILVPQFLREDDSAEIGKGDEFATQTYPVSVQVGPATMEKYLSAEIIAWAAAFGLGNVVYSAGAYTCTPLNKTTAGLELPYFTFVSQLRNNTFQDQTFIGCALDSFECNIVTAPGRSSSRISMSFLGTGQMTDPGGLTLPAKTVEHELPAASLAISLIGVDYVTSKDIVSVKWGWKNNLKVRYYPGSGLQDGHAKGGMIEVGDRQPTLSIVVRRAPSGAEYTKLKAGTTGTCVITQTNTSAETYTATFQQVAMRAVDATDDDGKSALAIECSPQNHVTNGVLSVVAKTAVTGICA